MEYEPTLLETIQEFFCEMKYLTDSIAQLGANLFIIGVGLVGVTGGAFLSYIFIRLLAQDLINSLL